MRRQATHVTLLVYVRCFVPYLSASSLGLNVSPMRLPATPPCFVRSRQAVFEIAFHLLFVLLSGGGIWRTSKDAKLACAAAGIGRGRFRAPLLCMLVIAEEPVSAIPARAGFYTWLPSRLLLGLMEPESPRKPLCKAALERALLQGPFMRAEKEPISTHLQLEGRDGSLRSTLLAFCRRSIYSFPASLAHVSHGATAAVIHSTS
jgi:hypothetical protein